MPRGDRTGPRGQGPKTGKGLGKCNPKGGPITPQGQKGTGSGRGAGQGAGRGAGQGRRQGSRRGQ